MIAAFSTIVAGESSALPGFLIFLIHLPPRTNVALLAMTDFGGGTDDIAYSLALQRNGKLILGDRTGQYPDLELALARYSGTGQVNQAFGAGGKVVTKFGSTADDYAVTIQRDGKIILSGIEAPSLTPFDFAVARYLGR